MVRCQPHPGIDSIAQPEKSGLPHKIIATARPLRTVGTQRSCAFREQSVSKELTPSKSTGSNLACSSMHKRQSRCEFFRSRAAEGLVVRGALDCAVLLNARTRGQLPPIGKVWEPAVGAAARLHHESVEGLSSMSFRRHLTYTKRPFRQRNRVFAVVIRGPERNCARVT